MPLDPKQLRKLESQRRRGWMIYLLYVSRPKPLDFASLIHLMDERNFPMSVRRFAEELDFLRSAKLVRVFEVGETDNLDDVAQAKLMQRYCDSDGDQNDEHATVLTTRGVNFQEGHFEETGITRVN